MQLPVDVFQPKIRLLSQEKHVAGTAKVFKNAQELLKTQAYPYFLCYEWKWQAY